MTQLFHTFHCVYCSATVTSLSPLSLGTDLQYPVTESDVYEDANACAEAVNWYRCDCCPDCALRVEDVFNPSLD